MQDRIRNGGERLGRWRRTVFAVLCLLASLLPVSGPALAADDAVSYAFLRDPTRSLTLSDVQNAEWTPITSTFGGGFTQAAYWLRVTFHDTDPLLLRFRPPTTDSIQLFSPQPEGGFKTSQTGEIVLPTEDAAVEIGWYGFSVEPKPALGPYYVRITTASPGAITVKTVSRADALRFDTTAAAWTAAIFALMFFSVILVLKRLDPFAAIWSFFFLTMIVALAVYLFWANGYARIAFGIDDPKLAEALQELIAGVAVFALVAFHHFYLRDFDPPPVISRLGFCVMLIAAGAPVLRLAGFGQAGLKLALLAYVLIAPVLILIVASVRRDAGISRRSLRVVYGVYIAVLSVNIAGRFGFFDNDFLYRHSLGLLCIISATMILALLWLQDRADRTRRLAGEVALAQAQSDQTVARDYRDAQLQLVKAIEARARDVFTQTGVALASGGFGNAQGPVAQSIEGLRDVIDRCLVAHSAESGQWRVIHSAFDPGESLREAAAAIAPPDAWRMDIGPVEIVTDRGLFELAVSNILSNAQRYGTSGKPVSATLRLERRDGHDGVVITLTNACDIARPFDDAKVFDKFYLGRSAREKGGTGLGLFITREALAAVSGEITLTGDAGSKTVTARLWVPSL